MLWEEVLRRACLGDIGEQAVNANYSHWSLESLFEHLGEQGRRLVLLLDEFEWLLLHPNFQDPIFFAFLRSLATLTGGLAIVLTNRFDVAAMNNWGSIGSIGSPLFNYMSEIPLEPFSEETVGLLLDRGAFDAPSRAFIRRVAGRHPWMLQAMAATLSQDHDHRSAAERFYEQFAFHFKSLWYPLKHRIRMAALVLSLLELSRWTNSKLNVEELVKVPIFGWHLDELAARGLATQEGRSASAQGERAVVRTAYGADLYVWRGGLWRVGTPAFAWWVRDVLIPASRQEAPLTVDEPYQYRFLLTEAQSDWLRGVVPNTPEWTGRSSSARALFFALLKGESR